MLLLVASRAGADPGGVRWSREPWGQGGRPVLAIALDPRTGEVAFGDARGASRAAVGEPGRKVARTAPVTDLVFDATGALWIATVNGLWHQSKGASAAADRSPAPGEAARRVHRVAVADRIVAVASGAGVFVSPDGTRWSRIDGAAPRGPVSSIALRCRAAEHCQLWWLAATSVWHAELEHAAGGLRVSEVREEAVPGAPAGVAAVDVLVGSAVADVVVLYPRAIALLAGKRAVGGRAERADRAGWTVWRPVMPPGAEARRLSSALGRLWLATDRGLLQAQDPRLGWSRAGMPAGWLATAAAAGDGQRLFSATTTGVLRGEPREEVPSLGGPALLARADDAPRQQVRAEADPRPRAESRAEPDVQRVQAMALEHQGLGAARHHGLRERVDRRSWWPELDLSVGYGGDRTRRRDFDQSFVSGATRQLFDRDLDRGDDWDAAITLSWDLAAAVFDPELVDLAREERAWIALRDDVLDEINLLYHERRRVLLDLEAQPDLGSLEAERLRLRVGELAAGLDAWTGGSFSRALVHPTRKKE